SSGGILDSRPGLLPDGLTKLRLSEEPDKASHKSRDTDDDETNGTGGEPNSSPEHTRRNGSGLLRSRGSLLRNSSSLSGNRSTESCRSLLGICKRLGLRRISGQETGLSGLHRGNVTLNLQRQRGNVQRHVGLHGKISRSNCAL